MPNTEKYLLVSPGWRSVFIVRIDADANEDGTVHTTLNYYSEEDFDNKILDELIILAHEFNDEKQLLDFCPEHVQLPTLHDGDKCSTLFDLRIEYRDEKGYTWVVQI